MQIDANWPRGTKPASLPASQPASKGASLLLAAISFDVPIYLPLRPSLLSRRPLSLSLLICILRADRPSGRYCPVSFAESRTRFGHSGHFPRERVAKNLGFFPTWLQVEDARPEKMRTCVVEPSIYHSSQGRPLRM